MLILRFILLFVLTTEKGLHTLMLKDHINFLIRYRTAALYSPSF